MSEINLILDEKTGTYVAPTIDKDDMLFIRACKTFDKGHERLKSVYKRTHLLSRKHISNWHLVHALNDVIAKIKPISVEKLLSLVAEIARNQELSNFFSDEKENSSNLSYDNIILKALIHHIRYMSGNEFPQEMIWPTRFNRPDRHENLEKYRKQLISKEIKEEMTRIA